MKPLGMMGALGMTGHTHDTTPHYEGEGAHTHKMKGAGPLTHTHKTSIMCIPSSSSVNGPNNLLEKGSGTHTCR